MKKYRNSIVILLVTLLSLSVFYVNQAFSSSDLPDFYIKQTSGEAKLLDTLTIDASYEDSIFTEEAEITKEGADYRSELSFFKQLDYWEKKKDTADMKNLTDQYPSFMRGKTNDNQLYNDTKQLIYVDSTWDFSSNQGMYNFRLKIDQLNKKTEKKQSFEVKIPDQEHSAYIEILDVQIIMNELRVMTLSDSIDNNRSHKLHEYTIDLKKEKIIDDNSVFITEQTEQQKFYINSLTDINPTQSNSCFIFKLENNIQEEDSSQTVDSDLYAYTYKTGKLAKLKLPTDLKKELLQEGEYFLAYDNNSIYVSLLKEENGNNIVNMIKYDFESQKIIKDHTIQFESGISESNIKLYQNKMIVTYKGKDFKPYIKIFNFEDGKSLFEGTIEAKNNNQKVDYKGLYIYQVNGL